MCINEYIVTYIFICIYIYGWWFQTFFIFHCIYGIIPPIDFHIFQRGRSTTNRTFDPGGLAKSSGGANVPKMGFLWISEDRGGHRNSDLAIRNGDVPQLCWLPEGTWRMIGLVVLSFKMLTTQGFNLTSQTWEMRGYTTCQNDNG